jgi:hypothetical protein
MNANFSVFVSYSQISVFNPTLKDPFNDWSPKHVRQGFSWRAGSVSFKTLGEGGIYSVEVSTTTYLPFDTSESAVRVIEVPFTLEGAEVEIGSISDTKVITVGPGDYSLRFHAYAPNRDAVTHIKFLFLSGSRLPIFDLMRVDPGLTPDADLLLTASPAGT